MLARHDDALRPPRIRRNLRSSTPSAPGGGRRGGRWRLNWLTSRPSCGTSNARSSRAWWVRQRLRCFRIVKDAATPSGRDYGADRPFHRYHGEAGGRQGRRFYRATGAVKGSPSTVAEVDFLVRLAGVEPATLGLEVRCSILLSYRRIRDLRYARGSLEGSCAGPLRRNFGG